MRADTFTVSTWLKSINNTADRGFAGFRNDRSAGPACMYSASLGAMTVLMGTDNRAIFSDAPSVFNNVWNNIVFTMPGSANADVNGARLWVNGVKYYPTTVSASSAQTAKDGFTIGRAASSNMEGAQDEVYLWNRVLEDCEIIELYNAGQGRAIL